MAIELQSASSQSALPDRSFDLAPRWRRTLGRQQATVEDRVIFTERLALLLQTGVSLVQALTAMQQQTEQKVVAGVIGDLITSVNEGKRFSAALAAHPQMFNGTYIGLVAAAEDGGFMGPVLEQLQQIDEKNLQLRSTLLTTLSYPAFLVAFSVAVVVFILAVVFPKFEDLFAPIRSELPFTTVVLLAMSRGLLAYWPYLLGGLVVSAWAAMSWLTSPGGKARMDQIRIRLPLLGELYVKSAMVQMLNVLGLSITNGVPVAIALKACQDAVDNTVFKHFIETLRNHVNSGQGISIGFRDAGFVPPMVKQMMSTGEETGNLGLVMQRIAQFYERDLNKRVVMISKTIEPVMLLVMGVIVGLIVASLILPIFKLSRSVG